MPGKECFARYSRARAERARSCARPALRQLSSRWACPTITRSRWRRARRTCAWVPRFLERGALNDSGNASIPTEGAERRREEPSMMDETFHLTPLDVRRYEFGRAMRGYDPERVDQFRDQVADELERLSRQNQELEAKAKGFHEQLRAFRERDKAINEALVSAQQLRSEIKEQAEKEGQLILRESRADADRLLEETRAEVRRMEDRLASLDRARRTYLAQIRV